MDLICTWSTDEFDLVAVSGALDFTTFERLAQALRPRLCTPGHDVVLDLSALRVLDSTAAGHLVRLATDAERSDNHLLVFGANAAPLEMLRVNGAGEVLGLFGAAPRLRLRAPSDPHHDSGIERLLAALAGLPSGSHIWAQLREWLVTALLPVAAQVARRFRHTGESVEDLHQVAVVALINTIDRFRPDRGDFFSYAVATIDGELKRHLRDRAWDVRPPRRLQELSLLVKQAEAELSQLLGHSPSTADLAGYLHVPEHAVIEARGALNIRHSMSLYAPSPVTGMPLMDTLGTEDDRLDHIDSWVALRRAIAALPGRTRKMLELRYGQDMTQEQIAQRLGVSQMHVSRILANAVRTLRKELVGPAEPMPGKSRLREPAHFPAHHGMEAGSLPARCDNP